MLGILLRREGFSVLEACNGLDAVGVAAKNRAALIFMDLSMPIMDGFEATRRIRRSETGRHAHIVALSAHCHEDDMRILALAAGCDECLVKPLDWTKLAGVIGQARDGQA